MPNKPIIASPTPQEVQDEQNSIQEQNAEEVGAPEVQSHFDKAAEQGFFGVKVDPRPNSDYSLEGGPPTAGNTSAK